MDRRAEVRRLVESINAQGFTPLVDSTPEEAREVYRQKVAFTLRGVELPEMHSIEELAIPSEGQQLPLAIYRPHPPGTVSPTLMYYHGGGFVVGGNDTSDHIAREIAAQTGSVVVAVDYRLAPEWPFPHPIDDGMNSIRWAWDNIDSLGGDRARFGLIGASAGALISTVSLYQLRDSDIDIAAQVLFYPSSDKRITSSQRSEEGFLYTREASDWYFRKYGSEEARDDPRMSPILLDDVSAFPPTLIVIAELDPLRDEGLAYATKLAQAGVDLWVRVIQGGVHGFLSYGGGVPALDRERRQIWRTVQEIVELNAV